MSRGMVSTMLLLALTSGASTGLKKNPVKLVKKKSEIIAKGANFTERQRGILRANFICWFLHVSDGATNNIGHLKLVFAIAKLLCCAQWNRFKQLQIETGDKMEIVCARLLNLATNVTPKPFIMMYLNRPSNIAEQYTMLCLAVHFDDGEDRALTVHGWSQARSSHLQKRAR